MAGTLRPARWRSFMMTHLKIQLFFPLILFLRPTEDAFGKLISFNLLQSYKYVGDFQFFGKLCSQFIDEIPELILINRDNAFFEIKRNLKLVQEAQPEQSVNITFRREIMNNGGDVRCFLPQDFH